MQLSSEVRWIEQFLGPPKEQDVRIDKTSQVLLARACVEPLTKGEKEFLCGLFSDSESAQFLVNDFICDLAPNHFGVFQVTSNNSQSRLSNDPSSWIMRRIGSALCIWSDRSD